jgi:hypothetical protein
MLPAVKKPHDSILHYSGLILRGLCQHILAPPLTEPVKLFIIPALADVAYFPFRELLETLKLNADTVPASTWLLFTVLSLERKHFGKKFTLVLEKLKHMYLMLKLKYTCSTMCYSR